MVVLCGVAVLECKGLVVTSVAEAGRVSQLYRRSKDLLHPAAEQVIFCEKSCSKCEGFWVVVCQYVPFRAEDSAENPIDCRIFFADNPR
jgi:hypothetical protein